MANSKISTLNSLTKSTVATNDVLPIVDTSASETKKITYQELIQPQDDQFAIADNVDNTKKVAFQVSGVTTGTTRTLTVPDANTTIVGTDVTQTLTNKTLTAPVINLGSNATGDMYYRKSDGTLGRIAAGADGTIIQYTSGVPSAVSNPSASDASYSTKGVVKGLTDAATSGLTISSGVISVNSGTSANNIVKLDSSAKLPAVDGSALTNLPAVESYSVNANETFNTYLTQQIPFIPTSTSAMAGWSGTGTTPFTFNGAGSYVRMYDSLGGAFIQSTLLIGTGSQSNYRYDDSKIIRLKFKARFTDTSDIKGIGLCITAANIYTAQTDTTNGEIRFVLNGATLYSQNANGTATSTNITGSLTVTNWNLYEIVFTPGVSAKFYVNGTLVATHTTNLPTTGTPVLAIGASANGRQVDLFCPVVSIQI
jgi:hypothetical protein